MRRQLATGTWRAAHAVTALAAVAVPAAADPLPVGDYALDLYQGSAIGSLRIVGMGGAATALAEGSAGSLGNPAAAAIRPTTSTSRWDWDLHLDAITGRDGGDVDNDGAGPDDGQTLGTLGIAIVRGRWGLAISQSANTVPLQAGAIRYDATAAQTKLALGYVVPGDDFVVGAAVQFGTFSLSTDDDGTMWSRGGTGVEVGATWQPRGHDLRLGAVVGAPVQIDHEPPICEDNLCGEMVFPSRVAVPWHAAVGASMRLAGSRWNQPVATEFRDERALLVAIDVLASGPVDDGIGVGGFVRQADLQSGASTVLSYRLGAEVEALPGRLRVRVGTYWEPSRFTGVRGRAHATFGLELGGLEFSMWGRRRLRATVTGDMAREFANIGVSVGFWH